RSSASASECLRRCTRCVVEMHWTTTRSGRRTFLIVDRGNARTTMAQGTGGSDFDGVWEEWSNASLMLFREASDRFAKEGENAIAGALVVASLLGLLAMPRPANLYWGRPKWPPRFFDGTVEPPAVQDSFEKLAPRQQHGDCDVVVTELVAVVSSAAKEWALGNPEQPDAREILRELFGLLWPRRLIPSPP